jgi:hypothetical protein
VADNSDVLSIGKADPLEHGQAGFEDRHHEPVDALRLLAGYDKALDSITRKSSIVFIQHCSVHPESSGPCSIFPRANRIAALLAEAHVAARVDALIRRGNRFRALDSRALSQLDLDRLQDFRDSLSPVRWRTLSVWVILLALAIAFPVATIADYLRVLAPKAIACSSTFSFRAFVDGLTGNRVQPSCSVHRAGVSLEMTLLRIAHLNLNPGSVIDTVLSVRASGITVLLLLAVVIILSICVVLLVFRSGFRLKRLAFSIPPEIPADKRRKPDHESLVRCGTGSAGLYEWERHVFAAVGLRPPRELPLDLVVSAGLMALPLTIVGDLLISATIPGLDFRTRLELYVVAGGLIVAVIVRLWWLVRVWRSRIASKGMKQGEPRVPDGATVLARSSVYGAVLLATAWAVWDVIFVGQANESVLAEILFPLLIIPALAWSLSLPWWYGLHRELAAYGRLNKHRTFRAPILCAAPLFSAAIGAIMIIAAVDFYSYSRFVQSGVFTSTAAVLLLVGIIGSPVGIYRMAWILKRLRCPAMPHPVLRANAAGLAATGMYVLPPAVFLYFERSLNRIWADSTTTTPTQDASVEPATQTNAGRNSRNSQPAMPALETGSRAGQ